MIINHYIMCVLLYLSGLSKMVPLSSYFFVSVICTASIAFLY